MAGESTAQDRQDLHSTGFFLCCFRKPVSLQDVSEAVDGLPLLHCEPELAAQRLIAQGLIEPVEAADQEPPFLRCTERGESRSRLCLAQEQNLPHASWRKAVMWLRTALGGGILGNAAYDILTMVAEELLEPAPSKSSTPLPMEPDLLRVPAGPLLMGTSHGQIRWLKAGFDWAGNCAFLAELPQHTGTLAVFEIGRYPVSNAGFKRFLDDGGRWLEDSGQDRQSWSRPPAKDRWPVWDRRSGG